MWATANLNYIHEFIEAGEPGFGKSKVQSPKSGLGGSGRRGACWAGMGYADGRSRPGAEERLVPRRNYGLRDSGSGTCGTWARSGARGQLGVETKGF